MRVLLLSLLLAFAACGEQRIQQADAVAEAAETGDALYTCPMHPHYISTDPDGSCPICGMDLVPAAGDGAVRATGADGIVVASEIIQTIGVRTVRAEVMPLRRTLRAYGTIEADERQETVVASRAEGWIEGLSVRAIGDVIDPDTVLYRLYSPDLVAAQKDYLNSLEIGNESRIASVQQRLISLGMQASAIGELERKREVIERVAVRAESGGIVSQLGVREGDYIKLGDEVMTIQSYDDVWVIADIPEQDLHLVSAGLGADLSFPSAPGAGRRGSVDYVYPTVDPATRTGRLRIVIDNVSGRLRPGAYADIRIETDANNALAVPTEAILRDSRGAHVILALGEGRFVPRPIDTGMSAGGMTAITSGLSEGEEVVASGQYLLDSEAKLREGLSSFTPPQADEDTPLEDIPLDEATLGQIDHFVDMALYFHEALTDGYAVEPDFIDPVLALADELALRFSGTSLAPVISGARNSLQQAQVAGEGEPLAAALLDLMGALEPWLMEGSPQRYARLGLTLYRDDQGRYWVQDAGPSRNPYGGAAVSAVPWPDRVASVPSEPGPTSDPHANH